MRKRKPSDFMLYEIRSRRREYTKKRDKETYAESEARKALIKKDGLETFNRRHSDSKKDRLLKSKDYWNLRKIPCPETLCLESNPDETIKFIRQIPGATSPSRKPKGRRNRSYNRASIESYFDFLPLKKICPASALIISACYFMYRKRGGNISVVDWEDWNEDVKNTFTKMGFFEIINFKLIPTDKNLQKVPIKGFCSDNKANNAKIAEYVEKLIEEVEKDFLTGSKSLSFKQALAALFEAAENSVRHAYPQNSRRDVRKRWWFGGVLSSDKKEMTLVCHDKGISIPRHIKEADVEDTRTKMREQIKATIKRFILKAGKNEEDDNLDHKRLEFAMKYAISSTESDGSGRGLSQITDIINYFPDGEVTIMSRRAHAVITRNKPSVFKLLDTSIIGTLIVWKIRL